LYHTAEFLEVRWMPKGGVERIPAEDADYLLRVADIPKMAPIIANVVIAMITVQSVEDQEITAASKSNSRMFSVYIIVLLATAVVIAVFTWLTWNSGNKLQDAIRKSADARINEAKGIAAQANERAARLEKEAASLRKEAASLLRQLVEQGPRSNLLYGTKRDELIDELKPFAGQQIEVRYCGALFNDNDAMGVAMLLQGIFEKAGWLGSPLVIENCGGTGIRVSFNPNATEPVRKAAGALALALQKIPLKLVSNGAMAIETPRSEQPPTYDHLGNLKPLRPLTNDTIVVLVAAHP
jgi:hypothetical protein